jgi:hypothetical protein
MTRDDIVQQALHKLAGQHDDRTFKPYRMWMNHATDTQYATWRCSCGLESQPLAVTRTYQRRHPLAFYELPLRW